MRTRILITDDHAMFRSGIRVLLERESDFEVVGEAGDGMGTIQAVRDLEVDVLLLDLSMPGMSGMKVAATVLKDNPALLVVVLTMHEDENYVKKLIELGVRGFVLKRSPGSDLACAIRRVVQGHMHVDGHVAASVIEALAHRAGRRPTPEGSLTPREQEICGLLARGHTNAEIASMLFIAERTVETHRANILSKLEVKSRAALARYAADNGLI